jgi:hypothetical protein
MDETLRLFVRMIRQSTAKAALLALLFLSAQQGCLANPVFVTAGADRVSFYYILFGNAAAAILESFVIVKISGIISEDWEQP